MTDISDCPTIYDASTPVDEIRFMVNGKQVGRIVNIAPSQFEIWAPTHGYDTAPAVLPAANRVYADRDTQAAFDASMLVR